jgi:hypothetical protein
MRTVRSISIYLLIIRPLTRSCKSRTYLPLINPLSSSLTVSPPAWRRHARAAAVGSPRPLPSCSFPSRHRNHRLAKPWWHDDGFSSVVAWVSMARTRLALPRGSAANRGTQEHDMQEAQRWGGGWYRWAWSRFKWSQTGRDLQHTCWGLLSLKSKFGCCWLRPHHEEVGHGGGDDFLCRRWSAGRLWPVASWGCASAVENRALTPVMAGDSGEYASLCCCWRHHLCSRSLLTRAAP